MDMQVVSTFGVFVVLINSVAEAHVCMFPGVHTLSFCGSKPFVLLVVCILHSSLTKQLVAC